MTASCPTTAVGSFFLYGTNMAPVTQRWVMIWSVVAALGCDEESNGAEPAAPPPGSAEPEVPNDEPNPVRETILEPSPEPEANRHGLAATVTATVDAMKTGPAAELAAEPAADVGPKAQTPDVPPRPTELAAPTAAEFKAWDRKDPMGEKHLSKWDKANMTLMHGYFRDLECARLTMIDEGSAYSSGAHTDVQWVAYKRTAVVSLNEWQEKVFRDNPRIAEKSKFVGTLLEMHELVTHRIPKAYDGKDDKAVEKTQVYWTVLIAKITKYTRTLSATFVVASASDCKDR